MVIKQISIFIENKPGSLARVTKVIGDAGCDIRALSMADTSDFGILRLIVDDPQKVVDALQKEEYTVSLTEVVAVGIDDTPGAFAKVVTLLADKGINIEYMYAFVGREQNMAFVILRSENTRQTAELLAQSGFRVLCSSDVYNM